MPGEDPRVEAYRRFIEARPPKRAAGVSVLDLGAGPALVFLHGMAGDGSAWWQQLDFFKARYRVLAPTYPDARDLFNLAERVLAALGALGVERFAVVGSSLGGYLAQYLVRAAPERIAAAVFANTFPPSGEIVRRNRPLAALARFLPEAAIRAALLRQIERVIVPAGDGDPFLRYYLTENARRLRKGTLLSRWRAIQSRFEPPDPEVPHLLVEATNDPLIPADLRAALAATYPRARRFVFEGGGHFPYLNRPEAYNAMLNDFLASSGIASSPPSSR